MCVSLCFFVYRWWPTYKLMLPLTLLTLWLCLFVSLCVSLYFFDDLQTNRCYHGLCLHFNLDVLCLVEYMCVSLCLFVYLWWPTDKSMLPPTVLTFSLFLLCRVVYVCVSWCLVVFLWWPTNKSMLPLTLFTFSLGLIVHRWLSLCLVVSLCVSLVTYRQIDVTTDFIGIFTWIDFVSLIIFVYRCVSLCIFYDVQTHRCYHWLCW